MVASHTSIVSPTVMRWAIHCAHALESEDPAALAECCSLLKNAITAYTSEGDPAGSSQLKTTFVDCLVPCFTEESLTTPATRKLAFEALHRAWMMFAGAVGEEAAGADAMLAQLSDALYTTSVEAIGHGMPGWQGAMTLL